MNLLYYSLAYALPILAASSSDESKHARTPCAIKSPSSGAFFDLNAVNLKLPEEGKKVPSDARNTSWTARGWDYGANFTLNICGSVLEKLDDVAGISESKYKNVSAYYEKGGRIYSIGQQNDEPIFRGRKLVLNYTDGSPCPSSPRSSLARDLGSLEPREIIGGHKDDEDDKKHKSRPHHDEDDEEDSPHTKRPSDSTTRRKNTIISLLCASDPLAAPMSISFVASPDSCTYFFEARSPSACGGVEVAQQQLGPAGVFGVIAMIAILVYLVGGCVYQRTVMHQRGWRQLPNYSLWAGIGSFFMDIFIILTSSCTRWVPNKSGYSRLGNGYGRGGGRTGRHDSDDENRLIDELDEDWND